MRIAVAALLTALAPVAWAKVVKEEPAMGYMREGERVLVDDGSCGPGKIKEVIGGNHYKAGGYKNLERIRRCIPKR